MVPSLFFLVPANKCAVHRFRADSFPAPPTHTPHNITLPRLLLLLFSFPASPPLSFSAEERSPPLVLFSTSLSPPPEAMVRTIQFDLLVYRSSSPPSEAFLLRSTTLCLKRAPRFPLKSRTNEFSLSPFDLRAVLFPPSLLVTPPCSVVFWIRLGSPTSKFSFWGVQISSALLVLSSRHLRVTPSFRFLVLLQEAIP